jgi:hypothetical protein
MATRKKAFLPDRPVSPVRSIRCSRGCGYVRQYTDAPWYLKRVITHPLYGPIGGEQLVTKDMWEHDCQWFLSRQRRLREITGYTGDASRGSKTRTG